MSDGHVSRLTSLVKESASSALGGAGNPRRRKADSHAAVAGCAHPATAAEGDYFISRRRPPFLSVRTSNSRAWPMETFVILRYFAVRATFSGSTTS